MNNISTDENNPDTARYILEEFTKFNKNSFLISHDGFNIQKQIAIIVADMKQILANLRKSQIIYGERRNSYQRQILDKKIGKLCKKYKHLFQDWSRYPIPSAYLPPWDDHESKKAQKQNRQIHKPYWMKPIDEMIASLRSGEQSPLKKKVPQKSESNTKSQDISFKSDFSWSYDVDPGPLDFNLHLQRLIQFASKQVNIYVHLPSHLKVTIIGVNQIDQENQRASITMKIQLKVKVPENAEEDSQLFRHLSKIKIHAISKKMKNNEQNLASFMREGQAEQDNSLFYGNAIQNDETANFSIWTDFEQYYNLNHRFQNKNTEEVKQILQRLKDFDGVLFSAKLKDVQVKIDTHAFNAPFQMLDFNGYINIQEIMTKITDWQGDIYQYINYDLSLSPKIVIKFNLINLGFDTQNIQHFANANPDIEIDNYDLAENLIRIQISNSQKSIYQLSNRVCGWQWKLKKQKQSINVTKNYYTGDCFAHFHFPFYRHPLKSIIAIFVPTIVLGIINLFIFYQQTDLADRIANISTLLISFVAMINVIQSEIKRTVITVTSFLIHLMVIAPLLCLIETFILNFQENAEPNPISSVFFWICVFIVGLNILYPVLMCFLYYCIWRPAYNLPNIMEKSMVLPGDTNLDEYNQVIWHNNSPISEIKPSAKIGEWQKFVSDFVRESFAKQMQRKQFRLIIEKIVPIFPKLQKFLQGKQGKIFEDVLFGMKQKHESSISSQNQFRHRQNF